MTNEINNELESRDGGFSLEDILAEFSSYSPPEEEEVELQEQQETEYDSSDESVFDVQDEQEPEIEKEPEPVQLHIVQPVPDTDDGLYASVDELPNAEDEELPDLSRLLSMEITLDEAEGDIVSDPFEPLPSEEEKKVWTWEGESVEPIPDGGLEQNVSEESKKAAKVRNKWNQKTGDAVTGEDSLPLPDALKKYSRAVKFIWPRLFPAFVLCLPSVYITICSAFAPNLLFGLGDSVLKWILVALNLAVMLLCFEVPVQGVSSAIKLKPGIETGVTIAVVVAIVEAIVSDTTLGLPYCTVTTLGVFLAQWGRYFNQSAVRRSLRMAMNKEQPYIIVRQDDGYEDGPAFFKTKGDTEGFVAMTESEDCCTAAMIYYIPIMVVASAALSFLCFYFKEANFLRCFAACMCAGLPLGGALSFGLPYSMLAKRLASLGAAVGGWFGAAALSGKSSIVVTDNDLFPNNTLKIEGLKIFGSFEVERVVGYTTALIMASESCLAEVFKATLENEKAPMPYIETFQTYEGGGLGAEINGDLVLVGSSNFMTLMGIKIAQGSKLRTGVYVAINGEIAGLFSVVYRPAKSIAYTLASMLRTKKLDIIMAVRDFNITPSMVRRSFKVNCDNIEFPTVEQRVDLSEADTIRPGHKAAVVTREGLPAFGDAVVGGRNLRKTAIINTVLSIIGGAAGLVLMFYLTFMGASTPTVAGYVLIYTLAWVLPVLLISTWAKKY
ncbi:MAG: hypothetical protein E7430_03645 [Ruminococcaceae bacterium]|nr:hypothetical protein [Oscillospiraceae bacterium]